MSWFTNLFTSRKKREQNKAKEAAESKAFTDKFMEDYERIQKKRAERNRLRQIVEQDRYGRSHSANVGFTSDSILTDPLLSPLSPISPISVWDHTHGHVQPKEEETKENDHIVRYDTNEDDDRHSHRSSSYDDDSDRHSSRSYDDDSSSSSYDSSDSSSDSGCSSGCSGCGGGD
jgi:hypothetical protein